MPSWHELSGQWQRAVDRPQRPSPRRGLRAVPDAHRHEWPEPMLLTINGHEQTVYGIYAVSSVLRLSPVTVRRWEREGLLPAAPIRLAYAKLEHERRLYSETMIDILADAIDRHGVGPRRRPGRAFYDEVASAWSDARAALGLQSTVVYLPPAAA